MSADYCKTNGFESDWSGTHTLESSKSSITSEYGHDYCCLGSEGWGNGVGEQEMSYDFGCEDLLSDLVGLVDLESLGAIAVVDGATEWIVDGQLSWLSNAQF